MPDTTVSEMLEKFPVGSMLHRDFKVLRVNPWVANLLEYRRPEDLVGKHVLDLVHPDDRGLVAGRIQRCYESDSFTQPQEQRFLRRDGNPVFVEVAGMSLTYEGRPTGLAAIRDLTQRKQAERALGDSEQKYRHLFEDSPLPTYIYDLSTLAIVQANQAFLSTYGYTLDEVRKLTIQELRPPEDRELMLRRLQNLPDGMARAQSRHRRKDGSVFDAEVFAHSLVLQDRARRFVVVRDVSERNRAEQELRDAQKMKIIGQLAGVVAHDITNLLTVIMVNDQLLLKGLEPGTQLNERARQIQTAVKRASELSRHLLSFGRRDSQPRVLDLKALLAETCGVLEPLMGEGIEVQREMTAEPANVLADQSQMEQVLMNLAINARDAMPQGGKLVFRLTRAPAGEGRPDWVRLSVADTGVGMGSDVLAHLYEPFFSTKKEGRGSGLGLASVLGIVKQCGGEIRVESLLGKGTRFEIDLPFADDGAQLRQVAAARETENKA